MKKKNDDVDKEKDFRCQSRDRGDTISRQERERVVFQARPTQLLHHQIGKGCQVQIDRQIDIMSNKNIVLIRTPLRLQCMHVSQSPTLKTSSQLLALLLRFCKVLMGLHFVIAFTYNIYQSSISLKPRTVKASIGIDCKNFNWE